MTDDRPSLRSELDLFKTVLERANKATRTIQTYEDAVQNLATFCETTQRSTALTDIDITTIRAYQAHRAETLRPTSMAVEYRSLQAYWKWATTEETLKKAGPNDGPLLNPMRGLTPPHLIFQPRREVSPGDHELLLGIIALETDDFTRLRNTAVLELFYATGARLSELSDLTLADVLPTHEIRVTGKGGSRRIVPFTTRARLALLRYMKLRARHKYATLPWLWVGVRGRFTKWGIGALVTETWAEAVAHGAVGEPMSPHAYRHGFIANYLARGGQEGDLMHIVGHTTTDQIHQTYARQTAATRARTNYHGVMEPERQARQ
jgi:integrase/recombinase XerD